MIAARRPSLLRLAGALLLLHLLFAFRLPWEGGAQWLEWVKPSLDLALFVGLGTTAALVVGPRRILAHILVGALFFTVVWHVAASVVPTFYGKEFEPYNDVLLVPGLFHLLTHQLSIWLTVLLCAIALAVLAVLHLGLVRCVGIVLMGARSTPTAITLLAGCQALVVVSWLEASWRAPERKSRIFHASVAADVCGHAAVLLKSGSWRSETTFADRAAFAKSELAQVGRDLGRLRDVDVFLLFIESYGRGILKSSAKELFTERMRAHAERLAKRGFEVATGSTFPSIRGGMSSLAHAELMTGVAVENRRIFDLVLQSDLLPLARIFADAGHATVSVQPAMPRDWPEGKFFGFQRDVFRTALPYSGRIYPWGDMPDQFPLAHVLETIVRPSQKPLFLMFVSVTSHAPFSAVPPYFEDWTKVTAPSAYAGEPAKSYPITWTNYAGHPQLMEAYMETIEYSLRTAFGFAEQLPRRCLVIVLGDHQPPLAGEYSSADASRDVPIHVLSKDKALLVPFLEHGFGPGLLPESGTTAFPSERFLVRFLSWFSAR